MRRRIISKTLPKPLLGFILLEIPETEKKQVGSFQVVRDKEEDRTWAKEGKVLAIGTTPGGHIFRSDHDTVGEKPIFKVGDTVYVSSFTGHQVSSTQMLIEYKYVLGVK